MSIRTLKFTIDVEPGERADKALARALSDDGRACSRRDARALIEGSTVSVDARRVDRSSTPLAAGTRQIEVRAEEAELPPARVDSAQRLSAAQILETTRDIIVLDKPPGLPTDPTIDPRRDSALKALERYLRDKGAPSDGLRAVHRLDRDTSGVLLVARSRRAAADYGAAFRERRVRKTYLALAVHVADGPAWQQRGGFPPGEAGRFAGWKLGESRRVDAPIGPLDPGPGDAMHGVTPRGKEARTTLTLRSKGVNASLFEATPETGRTHQVRIHMRHLGFPIAGDRAYGAAGPGAPRVMLHAAQLKVGEQEWTAPLPDDFREWAKERGVDLSTVLSRFG